MDELVEQYFQGYLSVREKVDLLRKSESDLQLKQAFIDRQNLQALLELSPKTGDKDNMQANYEEFLNEKKTEKKRAVFWNFLRYAAAAASLVGVTWFSTKLYFDHPRQKEEKLNTLFVPAGQRVSFTLEDGTLVWLNAQSKLSYPAEFSDKERHVKIEGEAFFEVAKNIDKPFIVSTSRADIKVLGTTFNVCDYPDEPSSRISLIEGKINVYDRENTEKTTELNRNEELTIIDNTINVSAIRDKNYFLWREGIYSFENERFEFILKKLELYYDVGITVKNKEMLDWRYTVKFRQRDGIDEIMRLLQRIHRFNVIKDEEKNTITISK